MQSGVASWSKCYRNWRVFAPCFGASSGRYAEANSASSARMHSAPFAFKNSGHTSTLHDASSFNVRPLETDLSH